MYVCMYYSIVERENTWQFCMYVCMHVWMGCMYAWDVCMLDWVEDGKSIMEREKHSEFCMYVCIHVCMYAYMYACIYVCMRQWVEDSLCLCMWLYCGCTHMHVCVCVSACVHARASAHPLIYSLASPHTKVFTHSCTYTHIQETVLCKFSANSYIIQIHTYIHACIHTSQISTQFCTWGE